MKEGDNSGDEDGSGRTGHAKSVLSVDRPAYRWPRFGVRKMDDFKIIECTAEKIIVSREPRNETEASIMRLASQDAILREWLNVVLRDNKRAEKQVKSTEQGSL